MKTEQAIEKHLCRRVREIGGLCVKLTGTNGIPDRLVILPNGRNIYIELKAPDGRLSPIQLATHKRLRKLNQEVYTIWNHEQVDRFIEWLICTPTKNKS